jgi:flavin reductase ActVB
MRGEGMPAGREAGPRPGPRPGRPPSLAAAPSADGLRAAMRELASGVVAVTTWWDERPWAMTVSACCSVCLDPPTVLVIARQISVTAQAIELGSGFGVSMLGESQVSVAEAGSQPGLPKFAEQWCEDTTGSVSLTPVIAGALAHVDCDLSESLEVGDHRLYLGVARNVFLANQETGPLVYFRQAYHQVRKAGLAESDLRDIELSTLCALW